jgi:hypothetical protein
MKTVFEAANSLEAHMILGLLAQAGIEGQILGEALQGGMGDLPAAGLVRVVVSDTDFVAARIIVEDWNSTTVESSAQPRATPKGGISVGHIVALLLGLAIGVTATKSYFSASSNSRGFGSDKGTPCQQNLPWQKSR